MSLYEVKVWKCLDSVMYRTLYRNGQVLSNLKSSRLKCDIETQTRLIFQWIWIKTDDVSLHTHIVLGRKENDPSYFCEGAQV